MRHSVTAALKELQGRHSYDRHGVPTHDKTCATHYSDTHKNKKESSVINDI